MKWGILILVVLLFGLNSCHPEAFSKQKYTKFRSGNSMKFFRKADHIATEKDRCIIIESPDKSEIIIPADPVEQTITPEISKTEEIIPVITKEEPESLTDSKSPSVQRKIIGFKTVKRLAEKVKDPPVKAISGRSSAYEIIGVIIIWLMILGLVVCLFTMIIYGNPSVGLFFILLGIVLLVLLLFGISMLGDRHSGITDPY